MNVFLHLHPSAGFRPSEQGPPGELNGPIEIRYPVERQQQQQSAEELINAAIANQDGQATKVRRAQLGQWGGRPTYQCTDD